MKRFLTWHFPPGQRVAASYYLEQDYEPTAVRIHAGIPPAGEDIEFDIQVGGQSLFSNHAGQFVGGFMGLVVEPINTWAYLHSGDSFDLDQDDFGLGDLPAGSWVTCVLGKTGGANITVQLELEGHVEEFEQAE